MRVLLLFFSLLLTVDVLRVLLSGSNENIWGLFTLVAEHLGAAGLCAEALQKRLARPIAFCVASLLPGMGTFFCLLLAIRSAEQKKNTIASWEHVREEAASAAAERRRAEQRIGVDIEPLIDAIRDEDPQIRIAAVEALQREMSPRAIRILQEVQRDPIFEVKLRATEALAAIAKAMAGTKVLETSMQLNELDVILSRRDYQRLSNVCTRLRLGLEPVDPEAADAIYFWSSWQSKESKP